MYRDHEQRAFARQLRNEPTTAEKRLWFFLRAEKLGVKFRRQAAIGAYLVDFICFSRNLMVELDGPRHIDPVACEYDRQRTAWLASRGFRVIPFRNQALDELLSRYRSFLLLIANSELPRELSSKAGASDLVQETMLRAATRFHEFAGANESEWRGWVRSILLNQIASLHRLYDTEKRQSKRELALESSSLITKTVPSISQEMMALEEQQLVRQAVDRLPRHYQEVIALRYERRLSFPEIGETLGCGDSAARKLWVRAIRSLQREVCSHGDPTATQ